MIILEIIFWLSVLLILFAYFGYPLLLQFLSLFINRTVRIGANLPSVTIIIPNYNEQNRIVKKLDNTLRIEYPAEKLQIIVASDCSSDGSDDIVRGYADRNIELVRLEQRQGKHYAQGKALEHARGEIIVFTDASIMLEADSIHKLMENFHDPEVGCVSSIDRIMAAHGSNSEGAYINYDQLLRKLETQVNSSTGMSGSFYAARASLCKNWRPHLSNDFYIPLHTVLNGYRAIVDSRVAGYYRVVPSNAEEFRRKIRTIVHGIQVLSEFKKVLNPFRTGFYAVEVFCHKSLRWLVPFVMIVALVSNALLIKAGTLYQVLLACQCVTYLIVIVARFVPPLLNISVLRYIYFLILANTAIVIAWYDYFRGEMYTSWEPSKR